MRIDKNYFSPKILPRIWFRNLSIYLLFQSKSLRTIFDKHISKTAQVTTDEWKGYKPIKDFNITQISSNDGKNFPTLHKVIHQVKSWIRGIYSWVSEFNIDRYLAEYSFRINRSQSKYNPQNEMYKKLKRNVHFLVGVERGKGNKKHG